MSFKEKLKKIGNFLMNNIVLVFGFSLLGLNLIAYLAPILEHFGLDPIADIIYKIYSFLCHQRPWRSIHLFDHQAAWCSRDTFIYTAMTISAVVVHKFKIRYVHFFVPILAIIPFALDGVIQLIAEIKGYYDGVDIYFYASTNFFRMLTGSIFGAGAGFWLFSVLYDSILIDNNILENETKKKLGFFARERFRYMKYLFLTVFLSFILYLITVQVWRITSPNYPPSGILDHQRYFPGVNYEEVDRCGHC